MTRDEFERLAHAWGGDLTRWPSEVRATAEAFAQATPSTQALLDEVRRLDRRIEGLSPDISSERVGHAVFAVANTIAATATVRPTRSRLRWLMPATGFACAAVIGVTLAITYPVDLTHRGADAGTIFAALLDGNSADQDWTIR